MGKVREPMLPSVINLRVAGISIPLELRPFCMEQQWAAFLSPIMPVPEKQIRGMP